MTTSRKFATSPDVLVAKGKIKSQMRLYWSQFRALNIAITSFNSGEYRHEINYVLFVFCTVLFEIVGWSRILVKEYMITVDYYSNFWEIHRLTSTT